MYSANSQRVHYYLPKRFLAYKPRQRSSGMFAVGDIVSGSGRSVFPRYLKDADGLLNGLRTGKFRFDISVSGKVPPVEVWDGQYLLVTPAVAKRHLQEFLPQVDPIEVTAVDREAERSHRLLLLDPKAQVKALAGKKVLDLNKDSRLLRRAMAWGDDATAYGYELSEKKLASHDIVLVTKGNLRRLALSDRFKRALGRALPEVRLIDFAEYFLV